MNYTFLVCTERSGGNLINRMLGTHSEISAPSPTHLIRRLIEFKELYANLDRDEEYIDFLTDVLALFNTKTGRWQSHFTLQELQDQVPNRTIRAVIDYIFSKEAKLENKPQTFVKEVYVSSLYTELKELYPSAKYLYMTRDPRDMALSWKNSIGLRGSVMRAANIWNTEQINNLNLMDSINDANSIMQIKYEDLLRDTVEVLKQVCQFLEVSYEPTLLNFHSDQRAKEYASTYPLEWQNLNKPIISDNIGKFKTMLSPDEIKYIESVCHEPMAKLGYKLEYALNEDAQVLSQSIEHLEFHDKPGYEAMPQAVKSVLETRAVVMKNIQERLQKLKLSN